MAQQAKKIATERVTNTATNKKTDEVANATGSKSPATPPVNDPPPANDPAVSNIGAARKYFLVS